MNINNPWFMNEIEHQVDKCKGVIFKADVGYFQTKRGFASSFRMNIMKRMSCPGCYVCGWLDEQLGEISNDWPVIGIQKVEHGKLYRLEICNETRDWESGCVDGWDLRLVEYVSEARESLNYLMKNFMVGRFIKYNVIEKCYESSGLYCK